MLNNALSSLTNVVNWSSSPSGKEAMANWYTAVRFLWAENLPAEDPTGLLERCLRAGRVVAVDHTAADGVRDVSQDLVDCVVPGPLDLTTGSAAASEALVWIWHAQPLDLGAGSPYAYANAESENDPVNKALRAVLVHSSDITIEDTVVRRTVIWPWVGKGAFGTGFDVFGFDAGGADNLVPGVPDVITGQWSAERPPPVAGSPLESREGAWNSGEANLVRYVGSILAVSREQRLSTQERFQRNCFQEAVTAVKGFPLSQGTVVYPADGVLDLRDGVIRLSETEKRLVWSEV